jgi:hypothetical protein
MRTTILITDLTLLNVWEALGVLSNEGVEDDAVIDIETTTGGMFRVSAEIEKRPAPNKGVKQRCRTTDHAGRRCVRGPRHPEQHRYENGE